MRGLKLADTAFLARAAASTPLVPVTAGLLLQLDANAITGKVNGDNVQTWLDTSGNSNDFTNPGAAAVQPTYLTNVQNGHPALDFDGNDYLQRGAVMSVSTVYSIFMAMKLDSAAGVQGLFRTGDVGGGAGLLISGGTREILHRAVAGCDDAAGTTSAEYWSAVKTAAPLTKLWVNGVNLAITNSGSGMNAADYGGWVGAFNSALGFYMDGKVFEILYYNVALSDPDRALVEAYLAAKWGI